MMTGADMTRFNRLEIVWWAIEVIQGGCSQLHLLCLSEYSLMVSPSDCAKSWHACCNQAPTYLTHCRTLCPDNEMPPWQ